MFRSVICNECLNKTNASSMYWGVKLLYSKYDAGIHTVAEVVVVCTMRDYRQDGSAEPAKVEARVRGDLEIVFRVDGSSKPRSFELKDISFISLRA